jgi:hypothetical protein
VLAIVCHETTESYPYNPLTQGWAPAAETRGDTV